MINLEIMKIFHEYVIQNYKTSAVNTTELEKLNLLTEKKNSSFDCLSVNIWMIKNNNNK